MKKENKIKYITDNGIFYIDHANHGSISVEESSIVDSAGLLNDIKSALEEFHLGRQLNERRVINIKTLLNE